MKRDAFDPSNNVERWWRSLKLPDVPHEPRISSTVRAYAGYCAKLTGRFTEPTDLSWMGIFPDMLHAPERKVGAHNRLEREVREIITRLGSSRDTSIAFERPLVVSSQTTSREFATMLLTVRRYDGRYLLPCGEQLIPVGCEPARMIVATDVLSKAGCMGEFLFSPESFDSQVRRLADQPGTSVLYPVVASLAVPPYRTFRGIPSTWDALSRGDGKDSRVHVVSVSEVGGSFEVRSGRGITPFRTRLLREEHSGLVTVYHAPLSF